MASDERDSRGSNPASLALRPFQLGPKITLVVNSRPSSRLQKTLSLIRCAKEGDRKAFEALFERYYPRVRGIVRARVGAGLRQAMETGDILQNSMVEAIRSFEDYQIRGDAGFIHWFAGIVHNRVKAASRDAGRDKRDRGREVALDHILRCMSTGSLSFEPVASEPLPVDEVANQEREELVAACLHDLKEKYREVILLRCYAGASWREAAATLGCSTPDAARVLYYRAIRVLKQAVEQRIGA